MNACGQDEHGSYNRVLIMEYGEFSEIGGQSSTQDQYRLFRGDHGYLICNREPALRDI